MGLIAYMRKVDHCKYRHICVYTLTKNQENFANKNVIYKNQIKIIKPQNTNIKSV